jgi:hypothetical protein
MTIIFFWNNDLVTSPSFLSFVWLDHITSYSNFKHYNNESQGIIKLIWKMACEYQGLEYHK